MIIKDLSLPLICHCSGPETIAMLAFSSVLAGGSAFMQKETNEENRDWQGHENEAQRRFAHDEAELQRQWQSDEWQKQFAQQSQEWYNQLNAASNLSRQNFLFEADYNSPVNQTKRLMQAGYNPSAIANGQGSGLVSAASGNMSNAASPSIPSGGTVSGAAASSNAASMPPAQNPFSMPNVGSLVRDLASAYSSSEEVRPTVDNLLKDIDLKNLDEKMKMQLIDFQEMNNLIMQKSVDAKIQREWQELYTMVADEQTKKALGEVYNTDVVLNKAKKMLTDMQTSLTKEQYLQASFTASHMLETWLSQMNVEKSVAANNYASASYSNALTVSEDALRKWKLSYSKSQAAEEFFTKEITKYDLVHLKTVLPKATIAELTGYANDVLQAGILTETMQEELRKAVKQNDWYFVNQVLTPLLTGAGASMIGGSSVYRSLPSRKPGRIGFTK